MILAINEIEDRVEVQALETGAERPWLTSYPNNIDWHAHFTPRPFQSLLDEAAARHADVACIDFLDQRLSYAEVDRRAAKLAKGL